ncbi:NmrA domain-containing protein [Favolaschia claudopus]|uniref:NmrA domain-containing protein n=1 Tax=Favolaschia claudopus TaxID=2862362 RepID=A0AAW0CGY3_9AGAR
MTDSLRIVTVFGATGLQGGAVVNALLQDGTFVPRAISRNPDSEASQKLKARGIQVVKGDIEDKAGLVDALKGSEAVFAVTLPLLSRAGKGPSELELGKNLVDAAKEADVKFFVWSSLPSISKISGGKYKNVVHYEEKEAIREYLSASGLPHASLLLSGFLEDLYRAPFLNKSDAGYAVYYPIFTPTDIESFIWVSRDVPAAVLALLRNYTDPAKEVNGKAYPVVTGTVSCGELCQMASKALGQEVAFQTLPPTEHVAYNEMIMAHAEHKGLFTATPVPNPDLTALGMKFSTIEEFMETELKKRFV